MQKNVKNSLQQNIIIFWQSKLNKLFCKRFCSQKNDGTKKQGKSQCYKQTSHKISTAYPQLCGNANEKYPNATCENWAGESSKNIPTQKEKRDFSCVFLQFRKNGIKPLNFPPKHPFFWFKYQSIKWERKYLYRFSFKMWAETGWNPARKKIHPKCGALPCKQNHSMCNSPSMKHQIINCQKTTDRTW